MSEREDNIAIPTADSAEPANESSAAVESAVAATASIKARLAQNRNLPKRIDEVRQLQLDQDDKILKLDQELVALKRQSISGDNGIPVIAKALAKQEKLVENLEKKCALLEKSVLAMNTQLTKVCSIISELGE
jgi:hypothetical protein